MKRAAFVYNPLKVPDIDGLQGRVATFLSQAGRAEALWMETSKDDPGIGMCQRAVHEACDVVIVGGGDGTVMAAATGLAESGVPMAILPAGYRQPVGP